MCSAVQAGLQVELIGFPNVTFVKRVQSLAVAMVIMTRWQLRCGQSRMDQVQGKEAA